MGDRPLFLQIASVGEGIYMTRVCVDAMGGDEKPQVVLQGIEEALAADNDLSVLVVGDADVVEPFASSHERCEALVSTETIGMGEHPAEAVRSKKNSSIVRGCASLRTGDADGFFSAGSTGAILVAATLGVGRIRGVKRPAIASPFPGLSGRQTVFLDMGANADARPEMIVQFARMGRAYSKALIGVDEPKVALLSNGSEDAKGSEAAVAAHEALAAAGPWFVGNCEGTDLLLGRFDVIVTDGFTGNVALKSIEGTAKFIVGRLKEAAHCSVKVGLGAMMMKPALAEMAQDLGGERYGGAMLLGTKAPVLIGHGATSVSAVKNATLATARVIRTKLVDKISLELAETH